MILTEEQKSNLKNKSWRISHFYKIRNKKGELIPFIPNRAQRAFGQNRTNRNIIIKSRQLGFTTYESIDILDDCLFNRNFNGLFIAQDLDTAKDIFNNKVELAWRNYPLKNLYIVNTDSARQMKFDFGDATISALTVDSSGRSGTFNRLHISEFDMVCRKFPDKAREILEGSIPAIPMTGRIDIETTMKGSEGRLYEMVMECLERGEPRTPTDWKLHFYNWTYDDEEINHITEEDIFRFKSGDDFNLFGDYQAKNKLSDKEITYYYFKWLSLNRDWSAMKSEYPTTIYECLEGSGNKMFDSAILNRYAIKEGTRKGDWMIFKEPERGHEYKAGFDVAEGVGQDSSTGVIMDFTPIKPEVVAIYRNNKIAPDMFAYEIKNEGERHENALVAPERNNHGWATITKLKEIYPAQCIYKDDKDKFGWDTNLAPLDISTPVITPSGWKTMGELTVGDKVIGSDGKTAKVLGVYPQGMLEAWELMTSDGTSIVCSEDHLWAVKSKYYKNSKPRILKTSQLKFDKNKMFIPLVKPVEFQGGNKELLIDPYFLGLLLGDGSFGKTISFATSDLECVNYISNKLPSPIRILPTSSKYTYTISRPRKGCGITPNELQLKLKELKLYETRSHSKFIPECYKRSSIENRLAILRGLMDTDGCAVKKACANFCSVSRKLAEDVRELTLSLGGYSKIHKYKNSYGDYFVVNIQLQQNPFFLTRKAEKYGIRKNISRRNIVSIEKLKERREMVCILIDNKDGLFAIKDYLLTHNTKPKMLYDLKTAIDNELIEVNSLALINEMRRYDKEDIDRTRFDENMTSHFDLLMALAIAFQMKNYKKSEKRGVSVHRPTYSGFNQRQKKRFISDEL